MLQEIIKKSYSNSILKRYFPKEFEYEPWDNIFKKVLEEYNITQEQLPTILDNYNFISSECPPKSILEYLIKSQLPDSPLWINIFEIDCISKPIGYHGSLEGSIEKTYSLKLQPKEVQLDLVSSRWIFNNHDEVEKFMDQYNKDYMKLVNIRQEFPISYIS